MTALVHAFHADGSYHGNYVHGDTVVTLTLEFKGKIPELYTFSDETGIWSHHRESTTKPGVMRWSRIPYAEVPAEIKAQMVILGLHCDTDGERLDPFGSRHK